MAGKPWEGEPAGRVHAEVQHYVGQCVDERPVPQELPSPDEASRVLLRAKAGYDPDPGRCVTATFKADLLSLPETIQGAPFADELGCAEVSDLLGGFVQRQRRDAGEYERMIEEGLEPRPYMDVTLGRDRRTYIKFVKDLAARGLLYWTTTPQEDVAVFFAPKKDGRIRMILGARRANLKFKTPPGVKLCSSEALSNIEVGADCDNLVMGSADVKGCFYRLRICKDLAEFFSLCRR